MVAIDLGVFHRKSRVVALPEALGWTAIWISLALVFCVGMEIRGQLTYFSSGLCAAQLSKLSPRFGFNVAAVGAALAAILCQWWQNYFSARMIQKINLTPSNSGGPITPGQNLVDLRTRVSF